MEYIHDRLRAEFERIGLSAADVARAAGEPTSQGLRDVLSGRKRLTVELLGAITATTDVDIVFVVTGTRPPAEQISAEERLLLKQYRLSPPALKHAALRVLCEGGEEPSRGSQTVKGGNAQQFNAPVAKVTGVVVKSKSRRAG